MLNTNIATKSLLALTLILAVSLFSFTFTPSVQAETFDKQQNKTCKKYKDKNKKACEKGFSKAYEDRNKKVDVICGKESSNNKTRKACKDGVVGGRALKKQTKSGEFTLSARSAPEFQCGEGDHAVATRFDFNCQGEGSPIEDLLYSLIRFLSYGVGLVLVASIIYAGIQYSSSEGNPEVTQAAKSRIQNTIFGLIFYIFIFAIIQFLVPGGLFA